MKKWMITVLFGLSFVSSLALADSSVCMVFNADYGYTVVTTCDGAQVASVTDNSQSGTVVGMTKALQKVLKAGYKLAGCTVVGATQTCTLTK